MADVVWTTICWQITDNFLRLVKTAIMEDFQAVNLTRTCCGRRLQPSKSQQTRDQSFSTLMALCVNCNYHIFWFQIFWLVILSRLVTLETLFELKDKVYLLALINYSNSIEVNKTASFPYLIRLSINLIQELIAQLNLRIWPQLAIDLADYDINNE